MSKLQKLNERQEALLARYRNMALDVLFRPEPIPYNGPLATKTIKYFMGLAGFNNVKVVAADSIQDAIKFIKEKTDFKDIGALRLGWRLDSQDSHWVLNYKFYENCPEVTIEPKNKEHLDMLANLILEGGVFSSFQFEHLFVAIKMPKIRYLIEPNGRRVLHAVNQKAIEFSDGTGYYAVHGRIIKDFDLYTKICSGQLSLQECLAIKNVDIRAIAIKMLSVEALLNTPNVQKQSGESKKGNTLYGLDLSVGNARIEAQFLVYRCPSTQKVHMKYVSYKNRNGNWIMAVDDTSGWFDPQYLKTILGKPYTDPDLAQALSHNMTKEEYLAIPWEA